MKYSCTWSMGFLIGLHVLFTRNQCSPKAQGCSREEPRINNGAPSTQTVSTDISRVSTSNSGGDTVSNLS